MARNSPKKIKKQSFITFLFADPERNGISEAYLRDFAEKIRPDESGRCRVLSLERTEPPSGEGHRLVHRLGPGDWKGGLEEEAIPAGYVFIPERAPLSGAINPGEFLRISLPEEWDRKTWYEVVFSGKNSVEGGGLIVPSGFVHYLLTLYPSIDPADTGAMRVILRKLGFRQEDVQINQEFPYETPPARRPGFLERVKLNLAWNTVMPVKEWRSSLHRKSSIAGESSIAGKSPSARTTSFAGKISFAGKTFFPGENPLFRLAFLVTAVAIFIILPLLSLDAGLSGDDEKHYQHAIKVYNFFTEDDPASLDDPQHKLNYYGQSFDFFTYLVIRLFNLEEYPYEARHVMVALSGAAAILVTGLLVKLFAGYAGGWLALVFMFLSPRFLGHSFNNPMDVPFALGYIFTIYHIILFLKKLPRIDARSALFIALGIGWTNGIRIGGMILVPYLFMFAGLYLLIHRWPWRSFSPGWWRFALRGLATLTGISLSGYLLSLLTWPYALQDIVHHPIQSFKVMSNIQVSIRVVYDGIVQWSDRLPWHYIPKNVLLTVPVIILMGWFASSFTWYLKKEEKQGFWYFMLWFTVVFPVAFIIYRESNVYGGWRHMMFIYPSMLALAAMAITAILERLRNNWVRYAAMAVVGAGMIHPLVHIIRNHPHTYVYFNEWSGGINNTFGNYETDYYTNSLGPASEIFQEEVLPGLEPPPGDPVRVVSNADIRYYFRNHKDRVEAFYSRYYDRGKYDWDYAILYCNYIHPWQLKNGLWPPKNTIREIKVDDVTVAAIVERQNRDDYLGSSLLAEAVREQDPGKLQQSINLLEQALAYDENNEAAYLEIGNAYTAIFQFEEARAMMDCLLGIYPEYDKALNLKGYTYLVEAEVRQNPSLVDESIRVISQAIQSNYKFYSGYYNLGLCYQMKNDPDNAIYYLRQAIRYNGRFIAAYERLAGIYENTGNREMAERVRAQLNRLR